MHSKLSDSSNFWAIRPSQAGQDISKINKQGYGTESNTADKQCTSSLEFSVYKFNQCKEVDVACYCS